MKAVRFCDDHTIAEINQSGNRNMLCARLARQLHDGQAQPLALWQIESVLRAVWEVGFDEGVEAEARGAS